MNSNEQTNMVIEEVVEDFTNELISEGESDPQVQALGVVPEGEELRIIIKVDGVVGTTNGRRVNGMLDFVQS